MTNTPSTDPVLAGLDLAMKGHTDAAAPPRAFAALEDTDRIMNAIIGIERLGDPELWYDIGPHFTCSEVDAVAELLIALSLGDEAKALVEGHTHSDEAGDSHYEELAAEYAAQR